jgi:chemotaxis protein methyltransferase CheR
MTLPAQDFEFLTDLIKVRSGISISKDKDYLLETRLMPVTRKYQLVSIQALAKRLRITPDEGMIKDVIEALTTNETLFFRDIKPFEYLRKDALDKIKAESKDREIRIWSCASSSGQEAYSIAMSLAEESAKIAGMKLEIIGTDIDTAIIEKARSATYSQFEIQRGLPITMLTKYFHQPEPYSDVWILNNPVKSMVTFREHNLLADSAYMGKFDVIFCRNVLIYFEPDIKTMVLNRLASQLKPHGLLFLGSADSVWGLTEKLAPFKELKGVFKLT